MRVERRRRRVIRTECEEREFWAVRNFEDFTDCGKARKVAVPALRPALKPISPCLSAELKVVANRRDVPSQALRKVRQRERIEKGLGRGVNYDGQAKPHKSG